MSNREICVRLEACVLSAFAEFDSYMAQFGLSLRLTTPMEEEAQQHAINSELVAANFPMITTPNPSIKIA
eukprot:3738536-Heterocapsa_arctica.AAC.1